MPLWASVGSLCASVGFLWAFPGLFLDSLCASLGSLCASVCLCVCVSLSLSLSLASLWILAQALARELQGFRASPSA